MIAYLRLHESHPPLFYAAMRTWRGIFGASDSVTLALPILLSSSVVPLSFLVAKRLFNVRTGVVTAALLTFLPALNDDGPTARPYSLLAILVLLICYMATTSLRDGGLSRWAGLGVSLALIVYCHNWGWVVVAGSFTAVLICALRGPEIEQKKQRLVGACLSLAILGLLFVPWANVLVKQAADAGHPGFPVHSLRDALELAAHALLAVTTATVLPALTDNKWIVIPASVLGVGVLLTNYRRGSQYKTDSSGTRLPRDHRMAIWVLTWTLIGATGVATAVSPFSNLLVGRCLAVLSPLLALLIGYGASYLWERREQHRPWVAGAQAIAIVMACVYAAGLYSLLARPRTNAREVVELVNIRYRTGDLIIVTPGYLRSSINHYLRDRSVRQVAYPDTGTSKLFDFSGVWARMHNPQRLEEVAAEIQAAEKRGERVWLITDPPSRAPLSQADSNKARIGDWSAMAHVRTHDLRRTLLETYGIPAWRSGVGAAIPRHELLIAELFSSQAVPPNRR